VTGDSGGGGGSDAFAARLALARQRLGELDLPAAEAARLHRRFIAVCDAAKAAGAGEEVAQRRLSAFLSALDQAARRSDSPL
jgi:hypothetical protein